MRWKVSKHELKMFPHPNADKLEVGRVGDYQVVVQKGQYKDGDVVVFAPEKSVLTGPIREEFAKYLAGPDQDRVKGVRLRGELSCGVIVPASLLPDLSGYAVGEDVSAVLGIAKYMPQVPEEMKGEAEPAKVTSYVKHEVLHFSVYEPEFQPGERILVTEKINGTQCSCVLDIEGQRAVMSKGLADEGIAFRDNQDNVYWRAVNGCDVFAKLGALLEAVRSRPGLLAVQVFGEVVPCAKGFNYGLQNRTQLAVFRVEVVRENGVDRIQFDDPINPFRDHWVPILYDGPCPDPAANGSLRKLLGQLCQGPESLSGKRAHIREGCVIEPLSLVGPPTENTCA